MNSHTSSGDVQTISMASSKPESCKLAHGSPCAPCLELEIFDREAQSILERLSEDRRKILAQINRHHDPFIQRLPLELASQIFAFCLPPQGPHPYPYYNPLLWSRSKGRYIKPFNIVLGAICRAWRQVAWSTPKLWSTLPISLHRCDNRAYKELVSEWLMRSAQIPLDVSLVHNGLEGSLPLTEEYVDIWKPFIDIVNGCSSRWRSFNIYASDLVLAYITGDSRGTSRLEYLKVDGPGLLKPPSYAVERSSHRFSLTNAIPMPSELVSIAMPLRSIDIDWSSLVTIEIGRLYLNESLVLLQWAPRLTSCKLNDFQGGQDEHLPSPTPTHHHTLQELDIRDQSGQQTAEQLLTLLILPSLISLLYDSEYNSVENVAAFLERSGCRLTTFHDARGEFHKLLALAPHLQALEWLQYPGYGFGGFKYPPNQLLPNLCEILLHCAPVSWCPVIDLIMSCPPKAFSIHVEDLDSRNEDFLIDEESARRFQDLIKKGYDIEITCRLWTRGEDENRDLFAWSEEIRLLRSRASGLGQVS